MMETPTQVVEQSSRQRRRRPSGEPPPLPRSFDRVLIGWLLWFAAFSLIWIWVFLSDEPAIWITELDLWFMEPVVSLRNDWLDAVFRSINEVGGRWTVALIGWATLVGCLLAGRVRHAVLMLVSLATTAGLVTLIGSLIRRPRPLGMEIVGDWEGFAHPSRPLALLAAVGTACGLSLFPVRLRKYWFLSLAVLISGVALAQVYTAVEHPSDGFSGSASGVAITIAIYRLFAPELAFPIAYRSGRRAHLDVTGVRGEAINMALRDQLNIEAVAVEPVSLESSAGSTPLRIEAADGQIFFGKLYASSHLRSDRSYKLGRTLLYGQLEDETKFSSVRHLVQHEDYMLHVMDRVGLPCPEPRGIAEITPHREYLLLMSYFADAAEISEVEITSDIIDQGLDVVAALWRGGLAHRDIKPGNLMVQAGELRVVDVGFAEVRPSPWRQAVDLANMMLVLALRSSPEHVYERARLKFTDEEIAEAFAASRGVTLPSQLRRKVRQDGRRLLARFQALAPARRPVAIQRWSVRRVGLTLGYGLFVLLMLSIVLSSLADIGLA